MKSETQIDLLIREVQYGNITAILLEIARIIDTLHKYKPVDGGTLIPNVGLKSAIDRLNHLAQIIQIKVGNGVYAASISEQFFVDTNSLNRFAIAEPEDDSLELTTARPEELENFHLEILEYANET